MQQPSKSACFNLVPWARPQTNFDMVCTEMQSESSGLAGTSQYSCNNTLCVQYEQIVRHVQYVKYVQYLQYLQCVQYMYCTVYTVCTDIVQYLQYVQYVQYVCMYAWM